MFFILFSFVRNSGACQELIWTTVERAEKSEEVYIGRVTSISIPELETRLLPKAQEGYLIRGADKIIRVKIYKKLKGDRTNIVEVKLGWCRGGQADLGSMVVLFRLGEEWQVKQSNSDIAKVRQALTNK